MKSKKELTIFEGRKIRRQWNEKSEKWFFSIVDIVAVLTGHCEHKKAQSYWTTLKNRLKNEGSEIVTKCDQLKLQASDGKFYETDVADTETIFRIIQSIPSPKAEPFKLWLARVGYERVEEAEDPERAIRRALQIYLKKGYTPEWVNLRLKSIEIRKDLTNEWLNRGIKNSDEFAILTDEITFAWAGLKIKDYKRYKNLKRENLRDNMTNLELVLNMLAEASTTEISQKDKPEDFQGNKKVAREGGSVAGVAREQLEKRLDKPVVSRNNYLKNSQNKRLNK